MPFRQHLCADQDAALTTVCFFKFILQAAFVACGVSVDPADSGIAEAILQEMLDAFSASTDRY